LLFKTNKTNQQDPNKLKLQFKFDITMLNMMIGYIFKKSVQITRKSLTNMRRLFDILDVSIYENNEQAYARVNFIINALNAKLVEGFENDEMIINYCRTDISNEYNDEIIENLPLYMKINYDEIRHINKSVEDRLQYYYLLIYKDPIYDTVERLDSGEYKSFYEINNKLFNICTDFINHTRKVKSLDSGDEFSLSNENFESNVMDIVTKLKNPSRQIRTGIQKLNEILSPAFMSGRLYTFMGLPGGWKSGMLLKVLRDTKKYNTGIQVKKPGKRPCALMITMENDIAETVERLFNMAISDENIRDKTPKQVIDLIKKSGELSLTDDNDIDIVIRYYPNRSIDTSDIYTIIDDLADDGKEVIILVLDYLKRIKPAEYSKEEKTELKNITNELKTIALEYDIPVVTAHQLNRAGANTIDAAMMSNKEDLARFLGRSNVGSAWEIVENCDWVCIINVEKKRSTGQYYLTFKRVKIRYKNVSDLGYFNHPFEMNNRMRLIDDIYMEKSLSEDSLASDFDGVDLLNKKGKRNATEREEIEDSSLFDFSSSLTK